MLLFLFLEDRVERAQNELVLGVLHCIAAGRGRAELGLPCPASPDDTCPLPQTHKGAVVAVIILRARQLMVSYIYIRGRG